MTDAAQVADDIQGEEDPTQQAPGQPEINPELVSAVQERIAQIMPTVQDMGKFEGMLQQNPELAKTLAQICPELIVAFVQVAQQAQGGQQTGMVPPGGADGAMAPEVGADEEETPQPGATSMGNAPPSMPSQDSPLRKQFYTGR